MLGCEKLSMLIGSIVNKQIDWVSMSENIPSEVCPAKIQLSWRICSDWSESSLAAFWIVKDATFHADWSDCLDVQADLSLCWTHVRRYIFLCCSSGPELIKTFFSCSTQLSMNFHLIIKIKIPTVKTFFMLNSAELSMKEVSKFCQYFKIYKQNKFHAQLSWTWKKL